MKLHKLLEERFGVANGGFSKINFFLEIFFSIWSLVIYRPLTISLSYLFLPLMKTLMYFKRGLRKPLLTCQLKFTVQSFVYLLITVSSLLNTSCEFSPASVVLGSPSLVKFRTILKRLYYAVQQTSPDLLWMNTILTHISQ